MLLIIGCVFAYICIVRILHLVRELTILTTKQGLSASFTSDHRPEDHHGQLPSYTENLLSCHNSWPFAVVELQNNMIFFSLRKASVTCCRRQTGQNTCSFAEIIHTFFHSIRRICDCVHELIIIVKIVRNFLVLVFKYLVV